MIICERREMSEKRQEREREMETGEERAWEEDGRARTKERERVLPVYIY